MIAELIPLKESGELLTTADGKVVTSASARGKLALFEDGACYMVSGAENDPEVISAIAFARRLGYALDAPTLVDPGTLAGFYHRRGQQTQRAQREAGENRDMAEDARMRTQAFEVLRQAISMEGVSDVIVKSDDDGAQVYVLVDGCQRPLMEHWSPEYGQRFMRAIYAWAGAEGAAERGWKQDGHQIGQIAKGLPPGLDSVRIQTVAATANGKELILRLMPSPKGGRIHLRTLGFDTPQIAAFTEIMSMSGGLMLVTGPTGSGKTTTLHGLLSLSLDMFRGDRWITVEDPVEIRLRHPNVTQIDVVNAPDEDNRDRAYNECLTVALRSAPRRLLLGEIRSPASAAIAFRAGLTGHGVLTTLHTDNALGAIPRLLDMQIEKWVLNDHTVMRGISAQRLLRQLCDCALTVRREDWQGYCPAWLEDIFRKAGRVRIPNFQPCGRCRGGYQVGRRVITEIVRPDERLLSLLVSGARGEAERYWREALDGCSIADQARAGVAAGLHDPAEVMRCVNL